MKEKFHNERTCKQCGRVFVAAPEHVFWLRRGEGRLWFCRYSCMMRYREEQAAKRKYKKRGESECGK